MNEQGLEAARKRRAEAFRIFVYCDDSSHRPKRSPIERFVATPNGQWATETPKDRPGRAGHVGSGKHLVGNTLPDDGWALDSDVANADVRTNYDLGCAKTPQCRRFRNFSNRKTDVFAVLDELRRNGVTEIPLAVLGATIQKQAERKDG